MKRAWNPEKVKSSGLPVRLKRVIGDEKKENEEPAGVWLPEMPATQ